MLASRLRYIGFLIRLRIVVETKFFATIRFYGIVRIYYSINNCLISTTSAGSKEYQLTQLFITE